MKFQEVTSAQWEQWKPYVDTVFLPWTQLQGDESPWEVTARLAQLADMLAPLERAYGGRVVTYPALHYGTSPEAHVLLERTMERLHAFGFRYCVVVCMAPAAQHLAGASLVLTATAPAEETRHPLVALWHDSAT